MNAEFLFNLLNKVGIPIHQDSPPVLLFACAVFILAIICLLSFINLIIYITVIYISEHEFLLNKVSNRPILLKFIKYYKNIRLFYIVIDVSIFLWSLIAIIRLCWRLISGLS